MTEKEEKGKEMMEAIEIATDLFDNPIKGVKKGGALKLTAPISQEAIKEFASWCKAVLKKEFITDGYIRDFLGEAVRAGRKGLYYDLPVEYSKVKHPVTYGGIWQALVGL